MFQLLADECFDNAIVEGLLLREPTLDILIATEQDWAGCGDDQLLALAAIQGRIVLTHDRQTMIGIANSRVRAGRRMPGLMVVQDQRAPGPLIEGILIILFAGLPGELEDRVLFVPM